MKDKDTLKQLALNELNKMQKNEEFWKEFGYPSSTITPPNLESEALYEPFDEDLPFKKGTLFGRWSHHGD